MYEPSEGSDMTGGTAAIPFDRRVVGGSGYECLADGVQIKAGGTR